MLIRKSKIDFFIDHGVVVNLCSNIVSELSNSFNQIDYGESDNNYLESSILIGDTELLK